MLISNKQSNFISFLLKKYNLKKEIEKIEEIEGVLSDFSNNQRRKDFSLNNNFKKALLKLENLKKDSKDLDDYSALQWLNTVEDHKKEINNLIKNANLIIDAPKNNTKNLEKIEERNSKIIINVSVFSTTLVLTLFFLVFLPKLSLSTLNFLDSCVLFPFNKLEEAYNFNYNDGVFHVAKIERGINQEKKAQYIRNMAPDSENFTEGTLKVSKNSLANSSKSRKDNFDNNKIIVLGMDNADLIKKNKDRFLKLLIKKIAEKQIEFSNKIKNKLLDLIY